MHSERIHGPYPNRDKWRIVVVGARGRASLTCETRDEALALIAQLRAKAAARTVAVTLEEYRMYLGAKGNRERSVDTTMLRLRALMAPVATLPLAELTVRRAGQCYSGYAEGRKPDTHRNALGQARTFGKWCLKKGYARSNPWTDVEATGQRSAGKEQLRVDEGRALRDWALSHLDDDRACAAMVALLLGLRASEIVGLTGRDVDAGGTLLWVPGRKTRAAMRELEIPDELRAALTTRKERPRLFPYRREWVREAAIWTCSQAGLDAVCAHGLRGLHTTMRVDLSVLARDMGHGGGSAVTERHYIAPGTVEKATARRVAQVLA